MTAVHTEQKSFTDFGIFWPCWETRSVCGVDGNHHNVSRTRGSADTEQHGSKPRPVYTHLYSAPSAALRWWWWF